MAKSVKPKAAKTKPLHHTTPFPLFDPGDFAETGARNVEFASRAASACLSGAAQLNWEMMNFMGRRWLKDIACAQGFMTAKTSRSAFHSQAEFVEDALRDYADEASKLLHMAADIANSTLEPVGKRAEEMLNELDEHAAEAGEAA